MGGRRHLPCDPYELPVRHGGAQRDVYLRLRQPRGQPPGAVVGQVPQQLRHVRFLPGRLRQGPGGGHHGRGHLQGALSRGRPHRGQAPAPAPAVPAGVCLGADHPEKAPTRQQEPGQPARQGVHPHQRYPSRPVRARADAPAGGRVQLPLGQGVGHHLPHPVLHQPHRDERGAGALECGFVPAAAAPCVPDHPGDRPPPAHRPARLLRQRYGQDRIYGGDQ